MLSARHTNAIYKIDRRTGDVPWRLAGKRSTFTMRPGATFKLQHDARVQPDGTLTLFDNVAEDLPARGRRSRGMALELDPEQRTATLIRKFEHPDGILSPTQGSMQQLDGGGASSAGVVCNRCSPSSAETARPSSTRASSRRV